MSVFYDMSDFVARHETMCVHVVSTFVSIFHSLNFVLGDEVADIEFYQTNQAMALKLLKTQKLVLLAWNVHSTCAKI